MHCRRGISVIAVIILILPIQLLFIRFAGPEPYPALFMPSFGGVPVEHDRVTVTRLTIVATSGTTSVEVDPVKLIPNQTLLAESIARFFFEDEAAVRQVASNGWLDYRLHNVGVAADTMEIVRERLFIDQASREVVKIQTLSEYSVEIDRRSA